MQPFAGALGGYYETIFKPAITQAGLEPLRADAEIFATGKIIDQIWRGIHGAKVLVAELTSKNPNVFYELAIRHVMGKPTVHLIRKGDAIPFDLKDFRTINIDTEDKYELVAKLDTYRAEIANHVREAVSEGSEPSNPVRTFAKDLVVTLGGKSDRSAY